MVDGNWGAQYGDCSEAVPLDAPVPKGNPVLLTTFVDANLVADVTTGGDHALALFISTMAPLSIGVARIRIGLRVPRVVVNFKLPRLPLSR